MLCAVILRVLPAAAAPGAEGGGHTARRWWPSASCMRCGADAELVGSAGNADRMDLVK